MERSRKLVIAMIFALLVASCATTQEAALVDGPGVESLAFASDKDATSDDSEAAALDDESDAANDEDGERESDEDEEDPDDSESEEGANDDEIAGPENDSSDESTGDNSDSSDDVDGQDDESTTNSTTAPTTQAPASTTTAAPAPTTTRAPAPTTTRAPAPTTTTTAAPTTTRAPAPTTTTTDAPTATTTTAAPPTTPAPSTGESAVEAAVSNEIYRLVNCARTGTDNWCQPGDDANWNPAALANERPGPGSGLTRSSTLNASSVEWSKQLTQPGQPFAHSPRSGIDYGENVAWYGRSTTGPSITPHGAIEAATNLMNQWMNSPGHRTNLLRPGYSTIGIGTAYDVEAQSFRIFATQQFS